MRIISKENKQVYTGIASAQNQQSFDHPIIQTIVNEASKEIIYWQGDLEENHYIK